MLWARFAAAAQVACGLWVLEMREAVDVPIGYQPSGYAGPNAMVPVEEMAEYALKAKAEGINFVGACCYAGPKHIRAMAEALGRKG